MTCMRIGFKNCILRAVLQLLFFACSNYVSVAVLHYVFCGRYVLPPLSNYPFAWIFMSSTYKCDNFCCRKVNQSRYRPAVVQRVPGS